MQLLLEPGVPDVQAKEGGTDPEAQPEDGAGRHDGGGRQCSEWRKDCQVRSDDSKVR